MKLCGKRARYASSAPQPEGPGAEELIELLARDRHSNAPYFSSGNLLFHSICTKDPLRNRADKGTYSYRSCQPSTPGLHHTAIYPTTCSTETTDRLTDEAADLAFNLQGRRVEFAWLPEGRVWTPWRVDDSFAGAGLVLQQSIGIVGDDYADVLGCRIEIDGGLDDLEVELTGRVFRESELQWNGSFIQGRIAAESPSFRFDSRPDYPGPWPGQKPPSKAVGTCYAVYTNLESVDPDHLQLPGSEGETYSLRGKPRRTLWVLFAAGFEREEVDGAIAEAIGHLGSFFDRARQPWLDFFLRDVPPLSCSQPGLERVYAEFMATGLLSAYDVPYAPFRYPISVPAGKCGAEWRQQFPNDSMFSSRAFLWLNDSQRCQHDLLQMMDVQFIHMAQDLGEPDPDPVRSLSNHFCFMPMVAWEVFGRTANKEFLRTLFPRFLDYDRRKSRPQPQGEVTPADKEEPPCSLQFPYHVPDPDADWLINSHLSGDDTCRADPFIRGTKAKFWYEDPETVLEPADTNLWLLGSRVALRRMADVLGEKEAAAELDHVIAQQRAALEKWMWREDEDRYADIVEGSHQPSPVREVANVTAALYGGFLDQERADRVMKDLLDPAVFWTPLPCPSCPVNHAGINGKPGFRPEGYWRGLTWPLFIYEATLGLYRYGRKAHAAYLIHRVLDSLLAASLPAPENYNPLKRMAVGMPLMSWSTQLLHPILTFISGLIMGPGDDLEFDPIALDPGWQHFRFGPFQYRAGLAISVDWDREKGYTVDLNGKRWSFAVPTRFRLARKYGDYQLVAESVEPVHFAGRPPITSALTNGLSGEAVLQLDNRTSSQVAGTAVFRLLTYDKGLASLGTHEFAIGPGAKVALEVALPAGVERGKAWLLAAIEMEGCPVYAAEGLEL